MNGLICTLVHISDPHFGTSFVIHDGPWWRGFVSRRRGLRHISGAFPHSYQGAGALAYAVREILRDRGAAQVPAVVIHTGDLTASGSQAEFSVGSTFLRHGHYLANGVVSGLRLDTEFRQLCFDVPGNHDLWHRTSLKDHEAYTSYYGGCYPINRKIQAPGGRVYLYGLDSNRGSLLQHRLAYGEIAATALEPLCENLRREKNSGTIQVVCLHHPLSFRQSTAQRICGVQVQTLRHREAIAKLLSDAGVHLVLAGHLHYQQHQNRSSETPLQFIAGSACQIGSRPSFWMLDLFQDGVKYTYFHIPKGRMHFEAAQSRSGFATY